ncbi:MAG: GAF domain-containing sensor histidine kinase [Firmicutes bacterium]|nr:GAF domain-containing sensor histidine kinase [Bacillota bacterium]
MSVNRQKKPGAGLSGRELHVLLEITRVVTSSLPLQYMFEVVHAYMLELIEYKTGTLYIKEKSRFNLKAAVGADDESMALLGKWAGSNFLLKKIKASGRPWFSTQFIEPESIKKHPYYLKVLAPLGIMYTMGAPIRDGHQVLGSIHLGRGDGDGDFTERDICILEAVANLLSPAVRNIQMRQASWNADGLVICGNGPEISIQKTDEENDSEERRMRVLSSVSSVMASELRNPLANLKMSFYSLARNYSSGVMAQQDLEQMDRSIKSMDKTVGFLNNLSRNLDLKREWLNVNQLLDEVLQAVAPIMDPDVVVVKDYGPVPKLFIDREKMHTVYGNIIENALDAMPCGGRLHISTLENGGYVNVVLEDNGFGMDREIGRKIFEPFFSAKSNGIGLGMTVCRKIVESHTGTIKVRSNLGKGTAVCIEIPVGQGAHAKNLPGRSTVDGMPTRTN